MKKSVNILLIFITIGFFFIPLTGYLIGYDTTKSNLENRAPTKLHQISLQRIFQVTAWKNVSDYIWDTLPYRDIFLRIDHRLDFRLYKDSPTPEIIALGKGKWNYPIEHTVTETFDANRYFNELSEALKKFDKCMKEKKKNAVIVFSPSAPSIYPEFLPDQLSDLYLQGFDVFYKKIKELQIEVPSLFLLWAEFNKRKQKDAGILIANPSLEQQARLIVSPQGMHWNALGNVMQTVLLLEHLFPGKRFDFLFNYIKFDEFKLVQSEIDSLWLRLGEQQPVVKEELPATDIVQFIKLSPNSYRPVLVLHGKKDNGHAWSGETVIIIHDSFFEGKSLNEFALYFETVYAIHWDNLTEKNFQEMFREAAQKASIIIVQSRDGQWTNRNYRRYNQLPVLCDF